MEQKSRLTQLLEELLALTASMKPDEGKALAAWVEGLRIQSILPRKDRTAPMIHATWKHVLKQKHNPAIEPFLRAHGREIVELMKASVD